MSVYQFPQILICGMDSLEKLFDEDYESVLIISDNKLSQRTGTLLKIKRKFDSVFTRNEIIISENANEVFEKGKAYLKANSVERIIAIGDGKILDCGKALSSICDVALICIVENLPGSLSDYDTLDSFLYRKSPDKVIIDPSFINLTDSAEIAYNALGTACLALEAYIMCPDRFISETGKKAFCEIIKHIMPAYRGEISARENLCNALFHAYNSYLNSFDYSWQSVSYRTAQFFSKWNDNKISILAVCITGIAQFLYDNYTEKFTLLADELKPTPVNENKSESLIDEIRKIQATLSIPYAVKNLSLNTEEFINSASCVSEEDRDLFYRCCFGNITFIKN